MRTTLRRAPLAAVAAVLLTGSLSAAHANCELPLKARYKCTATYSDGGSSDYCLRPDVFTPGDGRFALIEEGGNAFYCSCDAKGRAPNVSFGASSQGFFCSGNYVAAAGKVRGSRITGQGYDTGVQDGIRSTFTCQAVDTCP